MSYGVTYMTPKDENVLIFYILMTYQNLTNPKLLNSNVYTDSLKHEM